MRATSFLAPLFFAATTLAQAVEEGIAPSSPPPEGCKTTIDGNFTIGVLNGFHSSKRETAEQVRTARFAPPLGYKLGRLILLLGTRPQMEHSPAR
jgi:hypothetical protein